MKRATGFTPLDIRALLLSVGVVTLASGAGINPACAQGVQKTTSEPVSQSSVPSLDSFPKWAEFPTSPKNVPTPANFALRVKAQSTQQDALKTQIAAIVWDSGTPEERAAQARGRFNPALMKPIDKAMSLADIEALADTLRKRATPPPIVH